MNTTCSFYAETLSVSTSSYKSEDDEFHVGGEQQKRFSLIYVNYLSMVSTRWWFDLVALLVRAPITPTSRGKRPFQTRFRYRCAKDTIFHKRHIRRPFYAFHEQH